MTVVLAPVAVDLPSVSSEAECAQFYYGRLTTKKRCQLRLRAGSRWPVVERGSMQWHGFRCHGFGAPRPLQRSGFHARIQL